MFRQVSWPNRSGFQIDSRRLLAPPSQHYFGNPKIHSYDVIFSDVCFVKITQAVVKPFLQRLRQTLVLQV